MILSVSRKDPDPDRKNVIFMDLALA